MLLHLEYKLDLSQKILCAVCPNLLTGRDTSDLKGASIVMPVIIIKCAKLNKNKQGAILIY